MKEILDFLRDLENNNNREWFNSNKDQYQKVLKKWNTFCESLITEIGRFDEDIAPLTIKDCTYRIYRDTRFSKDKSPYKTHFGVFLAKGGKKSMHAGYYFHIGTGYIQEYPHVHMLASGNYCYDNRAVKILREDISDDWETFSSNILGKVMEKCGFSDTGMLNRCSQLVGGDKDMVKVFKYNFKTYRL